MAVTHPAKETSQQKEIAIAVEFGGERMRGVWTEFEKRVVGNIESLHKTGG